MDCPAEYNHLGTPVIYSNIPLLRSLHGKSCPLFRTHFLDLNISLHIFGLAIKTACYLYHILSADLY